MTGHIVLIPGLLCSEKLWSAQIDELKGEFDIAVADHTGHDNLQAMASEILGNSPQRFAIAGLSMGGYVAFEVLRQQPDRVERLALIDTQAGADSDEMANLRRDQIAMTRGGRFEEAVEIWLPRLVAPQRLSDHALMTAVREMVFDQGPEVFVRQQTAILNRPDSRADLSAIDCPTLVLCGRDDQLTPPDRHREMAQAIPDANLVEIEDCGHLSPMEKPDAVNRAMRDWLSA